MDARLKYLEMADGVKLYYEFWLPTSPKANIVFVHGLGDHKGRYGALVRYFALKGYGVCLYDQRGHGRSTGRRGHCKQFSDFTRDLAQIMDHLHETHPSTPTFLIGHSFGGQVAINFVSKYSKGLRGLVALSPNIEPLIDLPKWKRKLAFFASTWFPILKMKSVVDPEFLSHNPKVVEAIKNDPLMNWHVTARLGAEILKNLTVLPRLPFQLKIPCLFMHGSEDMITSVEATKKFYYNTIIQKKELRIYPGQYHELLNEEVADQVYDEIDKWIESRLSEHSRLARSSSQGWVEDIYDQEKPVNLWNHNGDNTTDYSK